MPRRGAAVPLGAAGRLARRAGRRAGAPQGSDGILPQAPLPPDHRQRARLRIRLKGFSALGSRHVVIHTDGACSGNPGPGGWAAVLAWNGHERELKGGEPHTTNNRMELTAAIAALEALKRPCTVELHTDSQYLHRGITEWIHVWKRNDWRTAGKKPVINVDLWQRLPAARKRPRGH